MSFLSSKRDPALCNKWVRQKSRASSLAFQLNVSGQEQAQPSAPALLARLGAGEKELVMYVLYLQGECGEGELKKFLSMHPGIRELRLRNAISAIWTDGKWLDRVDPQMPLHVAQHIARELDGAKAAKERLCSVCGIGAPSPKEKAEALMGTAELTPFQRSLLNPSATPQEKIPATAARFSSKTSEQRRATWCLSSPRMLTLSFLAQRLRSADWEEEEEVRMPFPSDEFAMLKKLLPDGITADGLERLDKGLQAGNQFRFGTLNEMAKSSWNSPLPILREARASAEFETLLYFLDVPHETATATIDYDNGFTKSGLTKAANDDSFTSLKIRTSGGREILLDVALDGVSGHENGYVASAIAKDTFEIAALSGWIRSPEDVKMALLLCDIAINAEKVRGGVWSMGTTAAVSYIEGSDFYGIHCGDSDWKIIRNGNVVAASKPHGVGNIIWSGLGTGPKALDINNGVPGPLRLQGGDIVLTCTDGISDVMCDHEYAIAMGPQWRGAREAISDIVIFADSRKSPGSKYPTRCGCTPVDGKDDDITVLVRRIGP